MAMSETTVNGYGGNVGYAPVLPKGGVIARDELSESLKRFEERLSVRRAELDQATMHLRFLEREVSTLGEACEAFAGIIRRSEEVDAPTPAKEWR